VHTRFDAGKRLLQGAVAFGATHGPWAALAGVGAPGYQIRCGETAAATECAVLHDTRGQAIGWQQGSVLGVYAHGLFESPAVMQALFGASVPILQDAFETLADMAQAHLDPARLARLLGP
jgi:adenosylcobyric acid synthase